MFWQHMPRSFASVLHLCSLPRVRIWAPTQNTHTCHPHQVINVRSKIMADKHVFSRRFISSYRHRFFPEFERSTNSITKTDPWEFRGRTSLVPDIEFPEIAVVSSADTGSGRETNCFCSYFSSNGTDGCNLENELKLQMHDGTWGGGEFVDFTDTDYRRRVNQNYRIHS